MSGSILYIYDYYKLGDSERYTGRRQDFCLSLDHLMKIEIRSVVDNRMGGGHFKVKGRGVDHMLHRYSGNLDYLVGYKPDR
jgi:hypothetical protein